MGSHRGRSPLLLILAVIALLVARVAANSQSFPLGVTAFEIDMVSRGAVTSAVAGMLVCVAYAAIGHALRAFARMAERAERD